MDRPNITKECVKTLFESRFVKVYDLQYAEGKHYYDATRRSEADIIATKSDEEAKNMLPDAVSCVVILKTSNESPKLLLSYEYRYPAGRFLLSIPAGLIDPEDREVEEPLIRTAIREIKEETGLDVRESDTVKVIEPFVYSTPGLTDESNGLVCAVVETDDLSALRQDGAVGSECFDGFLLLDEAQAREILLNGRDPKGDYYSVYTHMALMWFVGGFWKA